MEHLDTGEEELRGFTHISLTDLLKHEAPGSGMSQLAPAAWMFTRLPFAHSYQNEMPNSFVSTVTEVTL